MIWQFSDGQFPFQVNQFADGFYQLQDVLENCATLVVGSRRALLFDTMSGIGNLPALIRSITPLPLVVVNSHGHFDHLAGNYHFPTVHLAKEDQRMPDAASHRRVKRMVARALEEAGLNFTVSHGGIEDYTVILPVQEQYELGDLLLETVPLSGHTAGSVGLLCRQKGILLAGDTVCPNVCLFLPEALPLETYTDTLKKIAHLPVTSIVSGHDLHPFPCGIVQELLECCGQVSQMRSYPFAYTLIPGAQGRSYPFVGPHKCCDGIIYIILKAEKSPLSEGAYHDHS